MTTPKSRLFERVEVFTRATGDALNKAISEVLDIDDGLFEAIGLAASVWIGFEANDWRRGALRRKGYAEACPNVGKLLTNLSFTQDMENSIMAEVVNKKVSNAEAAKAWIKANPAVLDKWLDGVKTVDGKDALVAVKAKL